MSARDGIPKGLPQVIRFEDIQIGDVIEEHNKGLRVRGTVARLHGGTAWTADAGWIADVALSDVIYLISRPGPPEPKGLGAVVEAHTDVTSDSKRRIFVSGWDNLRKGPLCWYDDNNGDYTWDQLINPEIKSEGWTEN